uniref:Uncharacterized protein n=1 Tax=Cacopsylla melanoneura TaxID=428564 RepID=A0A8D8RW44_9HEMI
MRWIIFIARTPTVKCLSNVATVPSLTLACTILRRDSLNISIRKEAASTVWRDNVLRKDICTVYGRAVSRRYSRQRRWNTSEVTTFQYPTTTLWMLCFEEKEVDLPRTGSSKSGMTRTLLVWTPHRQYSPASSFQNQTPTARKRLTQKVVVIDVPLCLCL